MPNINASLLALRRKRLGYEQKQIAILLGHKSVYQLCRYETGQRTPNLEEAVKLSIIYSVPVHILFDRYYRRCREEIEKKIEFSRLAGDINLEDDGNFDYCSYLRAMNASQISEERADRIRHHIKILIDERSEKILGN